MALTNRLDTNAVAERSLRNSGIPWHDQLVLGHFSTIGYIKKFGSNPAVANGATEDCWDGQGTYNWMPAAQAVQISSSDNGDTDTVVVEGLDASYNLQASEKALTGQTPVILSGTFIRIHRIYTKNGGSVTGDVYVSGTGDATTIGVPNVSTEIFGKMLAANEQSEMAIFTVPAGYVGLVHNWVMSGWTTATSRTFEGNFQVRNFGASDFKTKILESTPFSTPQSISLKVPAKADIKAQCVNGAFANLKLISMFDLELYPEGLVADTITDLTPLT